MRSLHIQLPFPLGDQVVFTGVVREWFRAHSGLGLPVSLGVPVPEVWRHNPRVILRRRPPEGATTIEFDGDYSAGANERGRHMAHGFAEVLARVLGTRFPVTDVCGEIFLSSAERRRPSPVAEAVGEEIPYWIICNGGKFDRTVKWWPDEHYQAVVHALRGRVQFVQVGGRRHYHPRLEGTLDLRGWTDVRSLIRLVHRAEGLVCPITGLMHLAAAVPRLEPGAGMRPCVVLGGGIEPRHWSVYPGQRFHSTVGALECAGSGCWKSRTRTLGDGAGQDEPWARCVAVEEGFPKCMRMIGPEEVVASVETYLASGQCTRLGRPLWRKARDAARILRGAALDRSSVTPPTLGLAMDRHLEESRDRLAGGEVRGTGRAGERGVVTEAVGEDGLASAWVLVRLLRFQGCRLPVEVWLDDVAWEAGRSVAGRLAAMGCRLRRQSVAGAAREGGLEAGGVCREASWIGASRFREVLWLGEGRFPTGDPTSLFESSEFVQSGGVLWPGPKGQPTTPASVWRVFGLDPEPGHESQPGLMLVDRRRWARVLDLLAWCDRQGAVFRKVTEEKGDFCRLVCLKTRTPFHLVGGPVWIRERAVERVTGSGFPSFCERGECGFRFRGVDRFLSWFPQERFCHEALEEFRAWVVMGGKDPGGGRTRRAGVGRGPRWGG
jgi:hypothetical protein